MLSDADHPANVLLIRLADICAGFVFCISSVMANIWDE